MKISLWWWKLWSNVMVRRVPINQYHAILEAIIWWIGGSRDGRGQNGQKRQKENDDWCMSTSRLLQFGMCVYPKLTHWSMLFDTHTWQISYFKLVWERNCLPYILCKGLYCSEIEHLFSDSNCLLFAINHEQIYQLHGAVWQMSLNREFDSTITTKSGFLCTSIKHSIYFIHYCDVCYNFKHYLFFLKEIYRTRIQLLLKCSYPLTCYFEVT